MPDGTNVAPVDNSSASLPSGFSSEPVGDTYRGVFADWFNNRNISREDWLRAEQQNQNQFFRDMSRLSAEQVFNANEAQKNRDLQVYLTKNAYRFAVEDMKRAGLNPILAYSQGGATVPSGSVASSSSSGTSVGSSRGKSANSSNAVNTVAGLVKVIAQLATMAVGGSTGPIGF